MDKRFIITIGIIVAIFGGVLWFNNQNTNDQGASNGVPATSNIKGKLDSGVTLVEYGDFQCPACVRYFVWVEQTYELYKDRVAFQFRHLPLTQIHKNAYAASRAAEAAANQGKFWEMYNLIYSNQDPSGAEGWVVSSDPLNKYFVQYAKQIDLDIDRFKSDFSSTAVNNRINADRVEFNKTDAPVATPTFFLNGKRIQPASLEDFSKLLDEALKEQTS
jgi:protein-disulfide isomerase